MLRYKKNVIKYLLKHMICYIILGKLIFKSNVKVLKA